MFLGLLVISATEDFTVPPSFNVIKPACCNNNKARPPLVGSLGIATVAPFGTSFKSLYLLE